MKEKEREEVIHNLFKCGIVQNESIALSGFKNGCLSFRVPRTNNLPSNINDVCVSLIFDIQCGNDVFEVDETKKIANHITKSVEYEIPSFSKFVFNVHFSGRDDNGVEYLSGWHLDYEPRAKYVFLTNPKVYHPLFHLHYGGASIREIYRELNMHNDFFDEKSFTKSLVEDIKNLFNDKDTKAKIDDVFLKHCEKSEAFQKNAVTLQSNTSYVPLYMIAPRIPFPPIDEYLGLDFIVSNFFEKSDYTKFRKNHFFHQKITESQNKLWKEYYGIISGYWNNKSSNITPNMLIPSLFI